MSSTSIIALLIIVLLAIVKLLIIKRGFNVNAQDFYGNTLFQMAMSAFQRKMAKYLFYSVAKPEIKKLKGNQSSQNRAAGYLQFSESLFKKCEGKWWSRLVSNQRPPQCHCGALPTELRPHQGDGDCRDTLLTVNRFFA